MVPGPTRSHCRAMLEFFAAGDKIAALEAALEQVGAAEKPADKAGTLLALAWQLRQRDTPRALRLAQAAEELLAAAETAASAQLPQTASETEAERRRHAARLRLIRGEAQWLGARLDAALQQAQLALAEFAALGDRAGCADAHWLLAMLAIDQGDWPGMERALEAMAAAADGLDPVREAAAQAAQAYFAVFRERASAAARWGQQLALGKSGLDPAAACWAEDFLAVCAHHASDFVPAIRHFIDAHTLALASGQLRRAVIAATNTGDALNHLNDYQGALEWMERGLALARQTGWPGAMGVALLQTAHTLRLLNRLDASRDLLNEALALMAPLAATRNYAYALWHLSEVELAAQNYPSALEVCQALGSRADALQQADLQSSARSGQARALLALGRPQEALAAAETAHRLGSGAANLQVAALRVMADIHSAHRLAAPPDVSAPSVTLHYLRQALTLAAGIERLIMPCDLLEAAASEYARLEDFHQAYAFSLQARLSRQTSHSQEASNRAIAMQVTFETDRARADADHQRGLAGAQAERLETLEQLGHAGREITRHLDLSAIFAALDQQVHTLLDAAALVVYRVSADGLSLDSVFGVFSEQAGLPMQRRSCLLNDPANHVARCAREARTINASMEPGNDPACGPALLSLLCAPLLLAERLLGVMAVQSSAPLAYSEREVALFRTLCDYAAIALANADAQAQLVEQNQQLERLAISDPLTGLYNRLRLDQVLLEELARRQRSAANLSVILLDLDHFKAVNDNHGHQAGDQVLATVALLLKDGSRQLDVVGRWGGEEFLVVCRESDLTGAAVLAEKLRSLIAGHTFPVGGHRTASFGVATLRDQEDIGTLLARADAALYRAKSNGRNRVETA